MKLIEAHIKGGTLSSERVPDGGALSDHRFGTGSGIRTEDKSGTLISQMNLDSSKANVDTGPLGTEKLKVSLKSQPDFNGSETNTDSKDLWKRIRDFSNGIEVGFYSEADNKNESRDMAMAHKDMERAKKLCDDISSTVTDVSANAVAIADIVKSSKVSDRISNLLMTGSLLKKGHDTEVAGLAELAPWDEAQWKSLQNSIRSSAEFDKFPEGIRNGMGNLMNLIQELDELNSSSAKLAKALGELKSYTDMPSVANELLEFSNNIAAIVNAVEKTRDDLGKKVNDVNELKRIGISFHEKSNKYREKEDEFSKYMAMANEKFDTIKAKLLAKNEQLCKEKENFNAEVTKFVSSLPKKFRKMLNEPTIVLFSPKNMAKTFDSVIEIVKLISETKHSKLVRIAKVTGAVILAAGLNGAPFFTRILANLVCRNYVKPS
ncbi:MAG: hypothetical protein LBB18_00030 [Puniceicoccales bacterium]|nr:hypothetical protein [Puniceicoccales bacterium]